MFIKLSLNVALIDNDLGADYMEASYPAKRVQNCI